jgi:hypothetical protein
LTGSEVPQGMLAFVSIDSHLECGAGCACPVYEAVRYPFSFSNDALTLHFPAVDGQGREIASAEALAALDPPPLAIYSFYNTATVRLLVIQELPVDLPHSEMRLLGISASGEIILLVNGAPLLVEPGQSLPSQISTQDGDCKKTTQTNLQNAGLLEQANVGFGP